MTFHLSALIYIFNATIALWYGLRNLRAYKETKNEYSLMFFRVGLGVAVAEYFYGIPNLLNPDASQINGLFYLLAFFPLFLGLNEALRFTFKAWGAELWDGIAAILMPLVIGAFFFFHLSEIPKTMTNNYGLIHWGVERPYDLLFALLLGLVTIVPGIFFVTVKAAGTKALVKKYLFGAAFIFGGAGGFGVVLFDATFLPLLFSFIIQFLGFATLGSIFLVDVFMKEEERSVV